ncbi:hypothetical protein GJU39_06425 [Pedobacter petrophilus]|uniref:Uncharacterized protein n=1 Tax=Pedobacter petrophilus TaxID=1908241 RepID=A0A7K0FXN5_9SPHI|nr:hypothetical protein [Pedobacter petrophilus]MRX75719.1 hypothetical protein [Pedobacter petrophilus]
MTYELSNFSRIIDTEIYEVTAGDQDLAGLLVEINQESREILRFIQQSITLMEYEECKYAFTKYQQEFTSLLNKLEKTIVKDIPLSSLDFLKNERLSICKNTVLDLLASLESDFPLYFNYSMLLNLSALTSLRVKLMELIEEFAAELKQKDVDSETIESFQLVFRQLLHPKKTFSYQQSAYIKDFFNQLNEWCDATDKQIETLDIVLVIVSLGFNHPAFYHFCCRYFTEALEECDNINDQRQMLSFLKKIFKQVFKLSTSPYDVNLPIIEDAIQRYLDAELSYLHAIELTAEDLSSGGLLEKNFQVTFTVRQLAIFIQLQVEANIIFSKSPKVLHQYVTRHYSSVETEKISEKSFKNAYYRTRDSDMEKVIEKIVTMLALAQDKC